MKLFSFLLLAGSASLSAITHEVGPGKTYSSIGAVPWASLNPGDQVLIHWRPEPYREKWCINRSGTASAPIFIRGVQGANGKLPLIEADGAVTPPNHSFWNEERGLVKVGGANFGDAGVPAYITIEALELRGAMQGSHYFDLLGRRIPYSDNAAGIYVERGSNITIRYCYIHHNGNGIFVGSTNAYPSRDILIERSAIHINGLPGDGTHHNVYTSAINTTFQYNWLVIAPGEQSNNIKDRSANLVVRYNWIEGGNRQLDLVDSDAADVRQAASYHDTRVYGNTIVEYQGYDNSQIVHFGGDSGNLAQYRLRYLFFYNNTVISGKQQQITLVRLSAPQAVADIRNNIVWSPFAKVAILYDMGTAELRNNWISDGWINREGGNAAVLNAGGNIGGYYPMFTDVVSLNVRPAAGAPVINAGGALNPLIGAGHDVTLEYARHFSGQSRLNDGRIDIGAFEYGPAARPVNAGEPLFPFAIDDPAAGWESGSAWSSVSQGIE